MTENQELLDYIRKIEKQETKPPQLTKEQLARPLRVADQHALMHSIAPVIGDFVRRAIKPLADRIKELEARPAAKYVGVFKDGRQYEEGNFVTDHGAVWHCNGTTRQRPSNSADWTLAVKSGERR
jgi:hypothetical protein